MITARIKEGYGIVQKDVMCMPGISIHAKAVYALFVSYTGQKDACYPAISTICKNLVISRPTVIKAIRELEKVKLITVDRTLGESSIYYPNYILRSSIEESEISGSKKEKEHVLFTEVDGKAIYVGFEDYESEGQKHFGFWSTYSKKVDKKKTTKHWFKLTPKVRAIIMAKIPLYKLYQPDRQYRKSPYSYLLNECWNDEHLHIPKATPETENQSSKLSTTW